MCNDNCIFYDMCQRQNCVQETLDTEPDNDNNDVALFEEEEPEESIWSEFSYSRYDKPTNRWNTTPTEWELFMNEKIVY